MPDPREQLMMAEALRRHQPDALERGKKRVRDFLLDSLTSRGTPSEAIAQKIWPDYQSSTEWGSPEQFVGGGFGGLADRKLREGTLSVLDAMRFAGNKYGSLYRSGVSKLPDNQNWQSEAVNLLRRRTTTPTRLDRFTEFMRGQLDDAVVQNKMRRDPTISETDRGPGITYWPEAPGATAKIGIGTTERTVDYIKEPFKDRLPGDPNTMKRTVLEHELGERGTMEGVEPALPFGSHLGPSARANDLYMAGSRDPSLGEHWLKVGDKDRFDLPEERWFEKAYRQAGGHGSSPITPGSKRAEALVRILRRDLGEVPGRPTLEPPYLTLMQRGLMPPPNLGNVPRRVK